MWITVSLTIAAAALFGHRMRLSAVSRRAHRRRQQLLVTALRKTPAQPAPRRHLSLRRAKMERLLQDLETSATQLATVLAAEAGSAWHPIAGEAHESAACAQWRHARSTVVEAQRAYDDAVNAYEEFVQELALPLRAKAAERASAAMALVHAL